MSFTRPVAEKRLADGGAELFILSGPRLGRVFLRDRGLGKSQFTAMIDDLIGRWAWRTSELGAFLSHWGALVKW